MFFLKGFIDDEDTQKVQRKKVINDLVQCQGIHNIQRRHWKIS